MIAMGYCWEHLTASQVMSWLASDRTASGQIDLP